MTIVEFVSQLYLKPNLSAAERGRITRLASTLNNAVGRGPYRNATLVPYLACDVVALDEEFFNALRVSKNLGRRCITYLMDELEYTPKTCTTHRPDLLQTSKSEIYGATTYCMHCFQTLVPNGWRKEVLTTEAIASITKET